MKVDFAEPDATPYVATAATASGTNAVITVAASADDFWVIDWISWSYDGTPIGGGLTVTIGGVTVYQLDITAAGPGHIEFVRGLHIPILNRAVVVALLNGTTANKVNIRYR